MADKMSVCTPPESRSSSYSAYSLCSDDAGASPCSEQSRYMAGYAACRSEDACKPRDAGSQDEEAAGDQQDQQQQQQQQQQRLVGGAATSRISPPVRASMVDWMCSTAGALRLCSDALFLGVALLDRFLAGADPAPEQLGLSACACLAVAAKFEQATSPPLRAYLAYLSPQHTYAQLQQAEVAVLVALDYRLAGVPTVRAELQAYLHRLSAAGLLDGTAYHLASYLAELSLLEYHLLPVAPSLLAAACMTYTLLLRGAAVSDSVVGHVTGYKLQQLACPLAWLSAVHSTVCAAAANGSPYAATRKYLQPCCGCVAAILPSHV